MGKSVSFLAVVPRGRQYLLPAYITLCALLCALCLFVGAAHSQQPTDAQRNAIKSACRSDFMAQCSGVTPGGIEALTCLQQHSATLSPACRNAVSAVDTTKRKSSAVAPAETPGTAPAQSGAAASGGAQAHQPTQAQRNAVKSACRSDFMAQCSGVTPGGSEALTCLRQHNATLSPILPAGSCGSGRERFCACGRGTDPGCGWCSGGSARCGYRRCHLSRHAKN